MLPSSTLKPWRRAKREKWGRRIWNSINNKTHTHTLKTTQPLHPFLPKLSPSSVNDTTFHVAAQTRRLRVSILYFFLFLGLHSHSLTAISIDYLICLAPASHTPVAILLTFPLLFYLLPPPLLNAFISLRNQKLSEESSLIFPPKNCPLLCHFSLFLLLQDEMSPLFSNIF